MLQPGSKIGPFTVEAEIGTGATAVVYRVRHEALAVHRALKVLSLSHPQVKQRMMREGRLQSKLHHPNIVRVLDVLEDDEEEDLCLVLEYVEGLSLDVWLNEHADASNDVRNRLAKQIVGAVAHAHGEGLIHRDLKPANVLVEETDDGPVARVTDFGLAKALDAGSGSPTTHDTRTGMALGTPRYMAPEQMKSAKHVDARADVFSLGCLMYELYCGRPAFPQHDMIDVFNAVTDGDFVDPGEVAPVPAPALRAMRSALQLAPDDRPSDAGALLALLEDDRIVSSTDVTVPTSAPYIDPLDSPDSLEPPPVLEVAGSAARTMPIGLGFDDTTDIDDLLAAAPVVADAEDGAGIPWVPIAIAATGASLAALAIVALLVAAALVVLYALS